MRARGALMLVCVLVVEAYLLTRPVLTTVQQVAVWAAAGFAVWGITLVFGTDTFERALGPGNQDELGPAFELVTSREEYDR